MRCIIDVLLMNLNRQEWDDIDNYNCNVYYYSIKQGGPLK